MRLNICMHILVDTIEEAREITDAIKCAMANHPELALSSTINERLEPQEVKPNATNNRPTQRSG